MAYFILILEEPHVQGVLGTRVGPRKGGSGLSGRTGDDSDGALAAPEEVGKD